MDQAEVHKPASEEIKLKAARRAKERSRIARWDLDIAVFLFTVLIIVIILLFQNIGVEFVAPVAISGLAMVWLMGWRRGRHLYQSFYDEELASLTRELVEEEEKAEKTTGKTIEEIIEEKVQKALRERLK